MKTIFFAFSAQTVFKNFFFFGGSVYERMNQCAKDRGDMRFVIVHSGYGDHYQDFFAKNPPQPNVLFERVKFVREKTLLQKVFRFFYSYFIYTGTTAVMATIGIRPDEPPAGGRFKKFLGPLKWLISRTFGKSRWMRERVIPFLSERIFHERPFAHLFEAYQPDLVFVPHIYGTFDTELLAEAKRRGIKTLGMVSNWDHFDKYYLPHKADAILAQSEQIMDFAVRHQWYDPACIHLVGYPSFDVIVRERGEKSRAEVLSDLRLPEHGRYILYISGSAYCRDEPEIIQELVAAIERGRFGDNMYIVVRPYAGTRPADREYDREKFDQFLGHPRIRTFAGEFWGDVSKTARFVHILEHADVVHVVYSTAALEAAILDRPLVAPTFDGWHKRPFSQSIRRFEIREHFADVLKTGALRPAYNFSDLFRYTEEYLRDSSRDQEKRELLRRRLCWKTDGRASERVFDYMLSALS